MEANTQNTGVFNFELNESSKVHLQGLSLWAKITAIVGLVSVGLSLISTMILVGKFGTRAIISLSSGFIAWVISILLNIILFAASKNLLNAIANTDQNSLNKGFSDLAKYLRIIGILCIVVVAILLLVFLFALIMGALRGFK